ncbi:putative Acyl-CoA desaturase 1 (putative) [Rhodotorula toruloides]|nr:putative Acyl-CoA desaturase 1 (putative) [Rhodotorula toruloides]
MAKVLAHASVDACPCSGVGETLLNDKHTPEDHWLTALATVGEGYHNFHHEFPSDYRHAIRWYQYDPSKLFIWTMSKLGLASQLKTFPDNEIKKGQWAFDSALLLRPLSTASQRTSCKDERGKL